MAYSYKSILDGGADSDIIYYNASLTSTQQRELAANVDPPLVKFNEARDAPIIRNASQYYFSIIRFSMNGPNKNLPLFIPIIQVNGFNFATQTDPNLTIYYVSIPYQREWAYTQAVTGLSVKKIFTITGQSTPIKYIPETINTDIAPVPQSPPLGFTKQDLSSRYYWVYTYKHWCDCVNASLLTAMRAAWDRFRLAWITDPDIDQAASPFPYPTFQDFINDHDAPFIKYNEESKLFEIYGDTRAFNVSGQITGGTDELGNLIGVNQPLPAFVPPAVPAPPHAAVATSTPYLRLFFNANLMGLFSNFNNTYFGLQGGGSLLFPLTGTTPVPLQNNSFGLPPLDYTNEILFTNQNYTNILNNNPTLQGLNAVPPPAYNLQFLLPTYKQNLYWIAKQDYNSTNSLWSPVQSIVFTTSLLPIKNEYSARPTILGNSNAGVNTGSPAAFEPIIADFVCDQQSEKAEGWRDFVLYEPTAEYKMSSIQASHDEIRNIDVQVFWKYRLTGELIPISMYNCSDVSIKMMFRRIDYRS